ncbi:hypothetical protein niasHT_026409 [Heterodera trifolii]|uniref:Uncharacterized protein n=1 Tax=Heterodera trifolii TaxID=157864 RepID=A0ABD2JBJ1_9BILA
MSDSLIGCFSPPPFLWLLLLLIVTSISDDLSSSRCTLPPEFSPFFPPLPFGHRSCRCASDWADAFCVRLSSYERMAPEKAPSVCVCRQTFGAGGCAQFLTRCFRRPLHDSVGGTHKHVQHRLRLDQCACCFNQPDPFCTQLDCAQMRPKFETNANTSCHCHVPKIGDGPYVPSALCRHQSQLFPREIGSQLNSENFGHKISEPANAPAASSFGTLFPSVSSPLIRFFALLLLALVIVALTAIAICLLSNRKRIHLRRRERHREKEEGERKGPQRRQRDSKTVFTMGNGLLEEATV